MAAMSRKMPRNENKTQPTMADVDAYIAGLANQTRRADAEVLLATMRRITGEPGVLWGSSIVGFGRYHYRTVSRREGDWPMVGFSPRSAQLVVYIMPGFKPYQDLLVRLGKYKTGSSCLYIRKLEQVDSAVLEELIARSYADMAAKYGGPGLESSS